MSLMSVSRSFPAAEMLCAIFDLLRRKVAVSVLAEELGEINELLSGVRNSCDMFARNSDL